MKHLITLFLIMIGALSLKAQVKGDTIRITSSFWGLSVEQGEQKLSLKQAEKIMEPVPKAALNMKKARTNNTIAIILAFAGGAAIGWPLGSAAGGGNPEWFLAGIGAGLIIVAIPISSSATKHAKQAASIYNKSIPKTSYYKWNIDLNLSGSGIGIVFLF